MLLRFQIHIALCGAYYSPITGCNQAHFGLVSFVNYAWLAI